MLPHDIDVEKGYLSMMLLGGRDLTKTDAHASLFYTPAHSIIYSAISPDHANDFASVQYRLTDKLDEIGGKEYLASIYSLHHTYSADIEADYLSILLNLADKRNAILTARKIEETAAAHDGSMDEVLKLTAAITKSSTVDTGATMASDLANDLNCYLEKLHTGEVEKGIEFGFDGLPSIIKYMRPGNLILIGGRPGSGKTSVANSTVALHCIPKNLSCLIVSMEMTKTEEAMRICSIAGRIPLKKLMNEEPMTEGDYRKLAEVTSQLHKSKVAIIDDMLSIGEIRDKAMQHKKSFGLDLLVIDHAQLVRIHGQNEVAARGDVATQAKVIAKECSCVVMLPTQINRMDGLPYGASSMEADADVFFVVSDNPESDRLKDIKVRKNRNGGIGKVSCSWWKECAAFYNGGL